MYKIRKIKFQDHPILKNLELDFCGSDGSAVDTVIFAGENGTGKSTILNYFYEFMAGNSDSCIVEMENDGEIFTITHKKFNKYSYRRTAKDTEGDTVNLPQDALRGIYSDVDINFVAKNLNSVTSLNVDANSESRKSQNDLPVRIKQLLIDIQAIDDAVLSGAYKDAKAAGRPTDNLEYVERMTRFTNAFNYMFENLAYSRVENKDDHKSIMFQKNGVDVSIDDLSSGEKQIVYRGCFLLKDANAMNGAFVFIDEPEISLHPTWQMKIMDYYKRIFTGEDGKQTSQIFAVTHSPFVIHNENRRNDKVIVLTRNENGDIVVKDKPEYFKCNSVEAVQDAFAIQGFTADKPTVYLEGRTDEMYFNKALEVYEIGVPFQFKWIGYIDAKGEEANTGKDSLNKAVPFLISRKLSVKSVCLYDCDTNKPKKEVNNVITMSIPRFANDKGISVGVENALVFGDIDIAPYRQQRIEVDGYGIEKRIPDFQKMECCKHICSLDKERLKVVFANLKTVIESLVQLYAEE